MKPFRTKKSPENLPMLIQKLESIRGFYKKSHDLKNEEASESLLLQMRTGKREYENLLYQFREFRTKQIQPIEDALNRLSLLCDESEKVEYPKGMLLEILNRNLQNRRSECIKAGETDAICLSIKENIQDLIKL